MYRISHWFVKAAVLVLAGFFAVAAAEGARIEGHVYLEGETNHAGTRVEVYRYPLGIYCDETYTNSSGHFSIWVLGASYYDVIFSHPDFVSDGRARIYVPLLQTVTLPSEWLYGVSCQNLDWHQYPYVPPGTSIWFPQDEGKHNPATSYPIEWWYVNFHLTGQSTGREYGSFVAFFKIPPMRLFSISDLHQEETFTDANCIGLLTADDSKLDLHYVDQVFEPDYWRNMSYCTGGLHPFTYRFYADAQARENGTPMKLDIIMSSTKAPLLVGGDGLVDIGAGWSYYYSHTKLDVLDDSEITVDGLTEKISGYAWIDHQWGSFLWSESLKWEWFAIKLDDSREIMVADCWVDGEPMGSYSGGFNLLNADCSLDLSEEYTLTTLDRWYDDVSGLWWATKWRVEEPIYDVDLVVTADYNEQVMRILNPCDFPHACFWEGVCSVTGTIGGVPVSGKAFAELTHPSPPPQPGPCDYVGRCSDDMNLYYHEEDPPTYYYTEETRAVRDGEGGTFLSQDRLWFLMDMKADETICSGQFCMNTVNYFGLIGCYDVGACDTLYTVRLPEYGSAMPAAEYYGLARNQGDGTFWYSRPKWPLTVPPSPPHTTIYHVDGSGNELGSFVVDDYGIVGLAYDAANDHLWCIARGDPDMFLEYDVSGAQPALIQGPFQVPWFSAEDGAAGLEYDEAENAVVAIDGNTRDFLYFCDDDPDYSGPAGPGEPGVSLVTSCVLSYESWGVALDKGSGTVFIGSSSGPPFPMDEYGELFGCPQQRPTVFPSNRADENEQGGLRSYSYPNPFNPSTEISYTLPSVCHAEVSIFNILGQRVKTLVDEEQAAGLNSVTWNGTDQDGNKVTSGVYFYRIQAGDLTETEKMLLMK
ncbi:MAG: T9SS type A sorting domain-containing protein [Candidatus Zixiibacteriota bacterium]|nr:MAG: T9SS type A sorting domain-containing protein [candidate division Zixibacteria bacterium]